MKNILAIAVATALIAPAAAMADTTLYGKLQVSAGSVENTSEAGVSVSETQVESHGSRIGIKGSSELDNGLSATYGFEYGVNIDGDDAAVFTHRNQFVGVKGGFGEVRVGRHDTPAKLATSGLDAFADGYADMANIIASDGHRVNNVVAYINKFGPVGFAAAHSTDPLDNDVDAGTAADPHDDNAANTVMANYSTGPFYAGAGYTAIDGVGTMVNVGGSYKTEAGHFVNAVYETAEGDGVGAPAVAGFPGGSAEDTNMYVAGGVKSGAMTFKAAYGKGERDGAGEEELTTVGVDYSLGKKTVAHLLWNNNTNMNRNLNDTDENVQTVVGLTTEF